MTDLNLTRLRALAEVANIPVDKFGIQDIPSLDAFREAANPATMKALLDLVDQMARVLEFYRTAWFDPEKSGEFGLKEPGKRLIADRGQKAAEALRQYNQMKGAS